MKLYVAGNDLKRARSVMDELVLNGHTITFDWVQVIHDKEDLAQKARDERDAVREADGLVLLWAEGQESARYEAGMAMGLGKKIVVSGYPAKEPFFLSLPEVTLVEGDEAILVALSDTTAHV